MSADRRLTILHLDDGRSFRGGQQQVAFLAREQMRSGHRPVILCPPGVPLAERARQDGIPCRTAPLPGELRPTAVAAVARAVAEMRPDIVHAHTSHTHTLALLGARGGNRPLRVVSRRLNRAPRRSPWARWKYGTGVDLFLAVSSAVGRALAAGGVDPARIRVVTSSVDPARFDHPPPRVEAMRALDLPPAARVLGALGSLVPQKGHADLVRGFARLAPRHPDLHLVILGDGPLRESLQSLAGDLRLGGRVHLPGFRPDIGALLPHFNVVALPSLWEGLPNAVLDALSAGVPVVATPAGGTGEVIGEGIGGVLVPFHSPRALAAAIDRLLDDPSLGRELGRRGRQRVLDEFVPATMARRTEEAYLEALAWHRSGRGASGIERSPSFEVWAADPEARRDLAGRADSGRLPPLIERAVPGSGPRGRGRVVVDEVGRRPAVIKLHRHGGLTGRLLGGLGPGLEAAYLTSRRLRRLARVSRFFRARGGRTAELIGWLALRAAPFRRLYSATALVAGAIPLDLVLAAAPGPDRARLLTTTGRAMARWHDAGLVHRDLNLGNVLVSPLPARRISPDGLVVIDLDGARLRRSPGRGARAAALARFERSAEKMLGKAALTRQEWLRLLTAYAREQARLEARGAVEADGLARHLLPALRWRRGLRSLRPRAEGTVLNRERSGSPAPPAPPRSAP